MKINIVRIGVIWLLLFSLFGFFSCALKESYKIFSVNMIEGKNIQEHINSNDLDFARVSEVLFIPEIKAINHGKYIIHFSAYSSCNVDKISIKSMVFLGGEDILFSNDNEQSISLVKNGELYEGNISNMFEVNNNSLKNGIRLSLKVEVSVIRDESLVDKDLIYDVLVKGYRSPVVPT